MQPILSQARTGAVLKSIAEDALQLTLAWNPRIIVRNSAVHLRPVTRLEVFMSDFNRKMDETAARVNKSVGSAAERLEKESADFIAYLNKEVVPAVRTRSSKALRIAAQKLHDLANFMDENQKKS